MAQKKQPNENQNKKSTEKKINPHKTQQIKFTAIKKLQKTPSLLWCFFSLPPPKKKKKKKNSPKSLALRPECFTLATSKSSAIVAQFMASAKASGGERSRSVAFGVFLGSWASRGGRSVFSSHPRCLCVVVLIFWGKKNDLGRKSKEKAIGLKKGWVLTFDPPKVFCCFVLAAFKKKLDKGYVSFKYSFTL